MTAGAACSSCGTGLRENAKFCDECGAPTSVSADAPEYKQVTVLFADVVRSMDIAAAVGAERLREIMAEVVGRGACSAGIGAGSAQSSGFPRSPAQLPQERGHPDRRPGPLGPHRR